MANKFLVTKKGRIDNHNDLYVVVRYTENLEKAINTYEVFLTEDLVSLTFKVDGVYHLDDFILHSTKSTEEINKLYKDIENVLSNIKDETYVIIESELINDKNLAKISLEGNGFVYITKEGFSFLYENEIEAVFNKSIFEQTPLDSSLPKN